MDTLPPPARTTPGRARADERLAPDDHAQVAANAAATIGARAVGAIDRVLAGKHEVVEIAVATLLSGGHLLIEDIPGVGKTLLAQAMARSVGGTFHRIQGTSDLLPGDITGTMVPDAGLGVGAMAFRPGPVFANIVVFDELNRATPRTQSALLELAEEATVTVDGTTHPLPDPFMVVATQNPIDMAGTYGLGEGALDRFRAVVSPGRPAPEHELAVLTGRRGRSVLDTIEPVATIDQLVAARRTVSSVHVSDAVGGYVVQLLEATREHPQIQTGASTRGGVAVVSLAQAFATLRGRAYVTPDDVARAAVPALAHRVAGSARSVTTGAELVGECLSNIIPPTI